MRTTRFIASTGLLVLATVLSHAQETPSDDPWNSNRTTGPPSLQRVKVTEKASYFFDFSVPRGAEVPAFAALKGSPSAGSTEVVRYFLFGASVGLPVHTDRDPLRWDMTETILFCTRKMIYVHQPSAPSLNRYPIAALVSGPDDGRSAIDRSRLDERGKSPNGRRAPAYIGLEPMGQVYLGVEGWNEGDALRRDGLHISRRRPYASVIHYDVRALDDVRVELFMTVNGGLSRWLYDGERWKLKKKYAAPVAGAFLVCNDGAAIVTKRNGHWCLVEDLESKTPSATPVAQAVPGEAMLLIEDLVSNVNYFQHAGRVYDRHGGEVARIPVQADTAERMGFVLDFVRSRRE